ncbi:MAG: hypothetical protein Q9208_005322 [Pyrenodesmia sp. 3 TL-2023]
MANLITAQTAPETPSKRCLHKSSSLTAKGLVDYLAAKQLPCSEKYPTFDIDLRLPGETCGCGDEGCDVSDDLSKEIDEVERLRAAILRHEVCISFLRAGLLDGAALVSSQVHKDGELGNQAVVHLWSNIVGGLASKAESWSLELGRLSKEICGWLREVTELDDSEESDGSESSVE